MAFFWLDYGYLGLVLPWFLARHDYMAFFWLHYGYVGLVLPWFLASLWLYSHNSMAI